MLHDGNVEYRPNLGRGDWAARMLGDVDGDGLADLVLVEGQRVVVWINQSGTAWGDEIEVSGTPSGGPPGDVRLEDLQRTSRSR